MDAGGMTHRYRSRGKPSPTLLTIYDYIGEHPGISAKGLARMLGKASGMINSCLATCEAHGLLLYEDAGGGCISTQRNHMSYYDYEMSKHIAVQDYPFYAIIMAAMRQADTDNLLALKQAFPEAWDELRYRHQTAGGVHPMDGRAAAAVSQEPEDSLEQD